MLVSSSSGGLCKRSEYRAIDSLLSGPTGGVVGAAAVARSAGLQKFINLDMGGTSSDVSRYSSLLLPINPTTAWEMRGWPILPCVSKRWRPVVVLSAGSKMASSGSYRKCRAYPGPACYGFGGPFCLTDVNLLLCRLDPSRFSTPVVENAARVRLNELVKESGRSAGDILHGFLAVADACMANRHPQGISGGRV